MLVLCKFWKKWKLCL